MKKEARIIQIAMYYFVISIFGVQSGFAQSDTNTGNSSDGTIEEVIVSAQKREQSMQDVGISLSAFDSDAITSRGMDNYSDVAMHTPNFLMESIGSVPQFRIRGQGADQGSDTTETPVGFYVDGVYRPTYSGRRMQIFDLERIEVLRGPQGTLFGRNSTAGVVHFISKTPSDEFGGYAKAQVGRFGQRIFEGAVGGPISDSLRGRIAGKYHEDEGFQDNLFLDRDAGVTDVWAIRGQLEYDITDSATILVKAAYYDENSITMNYGFQGLLDPASVAAGTPVACSAERVFAAECVDTMGFNVADPDPTEGFSDVELENQVERFDISATLNWQISDGLELVSITSYSDANKAYQEDVDATPFGGVFGNLVIGAFLGDQDEFTQEVRLQGDSEKMSWVAGAYYFDSDSFTFNTAEAIFGSAPETVATVGNKSWALFGQVEYYLNDKWSVIGGLRYTEDDKTNDASSLGASGFFELSESELTWKAGINWKPSEDMLVYATVATGFKSADFVTQFYFGNLTAAEPADPETVTNYEIGLKSTFWDQRAQLNATVFYTDWEDKQATIISQSGSVIASAFTNFGDVDIYGAEFDLTVYPTDRLKFQAGLGLIDTKIKAPATSFFARGWDSTPFTVDGNELTGAPPVNFNLLARYSVPTEMGEFAVQADYRWQDKIFFNLANDPIDVEEAYGLLDLRAFWDSPDERYSVQLFVKNALDEEYTTSTISISGFDQRLLVWGNPRWYGASVTYNF